MTDRLVINEPQVGYYLMRFTKDGPLVPVEIRMCVSKDPLTGEELDRSPVLHCFTGDQERDPYETWERCAGRPIPQNEFLYREAVAAWAKQFAPDDPHANPRKPVDLTKMKPAF